MGMGSAPGEGVKSVSVEMASARRPMARWAALGIAAGGCAACAEMAEGMKKETKKKRKECVGFMVAAMCVVTS